VLLSRSQEQGEGVGGGFVSCFLELCFRFGRHGPLHLAWGGHCVVAYRLKSPQIFPQGYMWDALKARRRREGVSGGPPPMYVIGLFTQLRVSPEEEDYARGPSPPVPKGFIGCHLGFVGINGVPPWLLNF